MVPWIQIYSNLPTHKKTSKLADELHISSSPVNPNVIAVGMLVSLWSWAIQNAYDGDLSGCSARTIAEACRWTKKPDDLVKALKNSGYLDEDGHLHDWEEYAVLLMDAEENRKENDRRRAKAYRDKKRQENAPTAGASQLPSCDDHVTNTELSCEITPLHNITEHNSTEQYSNEDHSFPLSDEEERKKKKEALDNALIAKRMFEHGYIDAANRFADEAEKFGLRIDRSTFLFAGNV